MLALVEASASRQTRMLASAGASPSNISFVLADLRSRLSAATLYRLRELDDESRARALRRHASGRGLDVSDDVVGYVLTRCRRDMRAWSPCSTGSTIARWRTSADSPCLSCGAHRDGLSAGRSRRGRSNPSIDSLSGPHFSPAHGCGRGSDGIACVHCGLWIERPRSRDRRQDPQSCPDAGSPDAARHRASVASRCPRATQSRSSSSSRGRVLSAPATCDAPYGVPPVRVRISSGSR